jgi:hypothetical protein
MAISCFSDLISTFQTIPRKEFNPLQTPDQPGTEAEKPFLWIFDRSFAYINHQGASVY